MPLISVIIPVYNVEKYLKKCLDSVIKQSFKDIEIILINDGSTDSSGLICDEYASYDTRVKVIHKINGGSSDARNTGIRVAKGKYLLFLDSDDFWMENSLEVISKYLYKDLDVIFLSAAKYFENSGMIENQFECLDRSKVKGKSKKQVFEYLAKSDKFPASACTKLVKTELITKYNLYFEVELLSGEDIDWSTKVLLYANKFDVCNVEFYVYRKQRDNSITNSIGIKNVKDLTSIVKKWTQKCSLGEIDLNIAPYLLGLYSYEYSILMGYLYSISKEDRKEINNDVKSMKYILNYSASRKTKLVNLVNKCIGFSATSYLLNRYIRAIE